MKRLLRFFWFLRPSWLPILWRCNNSCWMLLYPDEAGWAYIKGNYEEKIVEWVKQNVRPRRTCVDIGANQGFYTLLMLRLGAKVYAFEPNPIEVRRLKRNLWLNRRRIVGELIEEGLGEREEIKELVGASRSRARSAFIKEPVELKGKKENYGGQMITTLDEEGKKIGKRIDLIKIDVEGMDLQVLKGGKRLIERDKPVIIVEIADVTTRQFGYRADEIVSWLEDKGYRVNTERKEWYRETVIAFPG